MKLLTIARDLKRRKARERTGHFVVEGVRAVEELLSSNLRVIGALVSPALSVTERGQALLAQLSAQDVDLLHVDQSDFDTAAHTDSPQGVLAIAAVPARTFGEVAISDQMSLLVLDGIQDPGNTGTMLRTAAAFDVSCTVALPGTVDLWSAKVVRSSMGAHFSHNAFHTSHAELAEYLVRAGIELWGATSVGEPPSSWSLPPRVALAVGNEGAGMSQAVREMVSREVGVAIQPKVESLNVSVAAAILLYEMRRHRVELR